MRPTMVLNRVADHLWGLLEQGPEDRVSKVCRIALLLKSPFAFVKHLVERGIEILRFPVLYGALGNRLVECIYNG
jgi:hypothetical protein